MSATGSVVSWLARLREGDAGAAQHLWEQYFARMVGLARKRLRGARRREADEEDVALSAFDSFCRGAEQGHFPDLRERNNLWRLLVNITARKALHLLAREGRLKRGGGKVRGESALRDAAEGEGIEAVVGHEPTPEFAAQVAEECQRLLGRLGDEQQRAIAVWKMEGHTNEDIAARLGCALATVERRLRLIRKTWDGCSCPKGE
jgi:DNA-directed RNA polymerase specialized sigma24 family protein